MYKIIIATSTHIEQLSSLEKRSFLTNRLSTRSIRRFISLGNILVITKYNKVIGSAVIITRKNRTGARIYSLAIDPDYHKQGLGELLLKEIEDRYKHSKEIRLEVREDNSPAIKFYIKHGYVESGYIDDYYHDGCKALKFVKKLHDLSI
jgi:ribosomal protein S18 acetylase RimI-like enzyme